MFAALLITCIIYLALQLAPQTLGETARRHLLQRLQQHYSDCQVTIRRGTYQNDVGLIFEGIRIRDRGSYSSMPSVDEVLIEKLVLIADLDPKKLKEHESPFVPKRMVIDGLQATTGVSDEGKLTISKLWPLPQFGPGAPRIEIHDTAISIVRRERAPHPLEIHFQEILLAKDPSSGAQRIAAVGVAPFANHISLQASTSANGFSVRGEVREAHLGPELFDQFPGAWTSSISAARGVDAFVDVKFDVEKPTGGNTKFHVNSSVHDGRFDHPALPTPITAFRGLATFDNSGVHVKASQGQFGNAVIRVSGFADPRAWPNAAHFQLSAEGLLLDENLAQRLPESMRSGWDKLQPYGHVDVERCSVGWRNGRWTTDAVIQANGVNVRYEKLPYPAEQLVGQVEIADGIATCYKMNGRVGGRHMRCAFRLPIMPGITKEKLFAIRMDGPVAIDTTLVDSLTPRSAPESKLESFVRSLRPQGAAHLVHARLETDAAGRQSRTIDLRIVNGNLRYDKFAYPLYNVTGQVKVVDDIVWISDFEANNASAGHVRCNGWYRMPPKSIPGATQDAQSLRGAGTSRRGAKMAELTGEPSMRLEFDATKIPMDGTLRSSLPEPSRHAWDAISPSGVLDELRVIVMQSIHAGPIKTDIAAVQHATDAVTNRVLSLQPPALPYRLDVLSGSARFDGEQVTIDSLSTQHDATRVAADGKCVRGKDGRWNLMLNLHGGSRLHPDAELIAALPRQLREAMRRLQLRGPLGVRGTTQMLLADATHVDPIVNWDLNLQLEGNRIGDIGPVHSLRGEISTKGSSDASGMRANGDVYLDSMHINDLHVTAVKGPFLIDGDRMQLGVTNQSPQQLYGGSSEPVPILRPIQGRIFDGEVELSGQLALSSGKFDVAVSVNQGRVPTLLADLGKGSSELSGNFNGRAELQGFLGTTELLKGNGSATVTGANLYQLPLLVQLLNLLRITPTEDVAFTDGNAQFQIVENQINFQKLQLWGDLVALDGGGTLNRRRELDLTFNTRVSPQNSFTRIVRPLRNSKYTLLTVDVRGPIESPTIQRRTLEGVGETLELLFPVMNDVKDQRAENGTRWFPSFFR